MSRSARGTILLEDARLVSTEHHGAGQRVVRLAAPRIAGRCEPGAFVHLRCDPRMDMRRPMSVMRADPGAGWIEVLYKIVGEGTAALAERGEGERLSVLGPIGVGFSPDPARPRALLVGGGVGIPPMIFLAERLRADPRYRPFVIMGSEVPFPFDPCTSGILVPGMPAGVVAGMPLVEEWGIPSRLASRLGYAGCFDGFVTDLARRWLEAIGPAGRDGVAIYACGPDPMLAACAALARELELPCQVSLEEHMACAVGGCAGCTVRVRTARGPAMRRVCVDGPVFDAREVVWA